MWYTLHHYLYAVSELGNASVYEEFMARANNWVNLWNSDVEEDGFSGFIMPKYQVRT
jgi:putative alpha-1,2-mannosidase